MRSFSDPSFSPTEFGRLFEVSNKSVWQWEKSGLISSQIRTINSKKKKVYTLEDVLKVRQKRPVKLSAKKIQTFSNIKGGVGKTTLSTQYVMQCSMLGLKCLAIDLDPQAHMTYHLGMETSDDETKTIYDVLIDKLDIKKSIQKINETLHIIPSTLKVSLTEKDLQDEEDREFLLGTAVNSIKQDYDLIVVDTNPVISVLNSSMQIISDEILIVCATEFLSFKGLKLMFDQINDLTKDFNVSPKIRVIANLFDMRDGICQEALGAIKSHYKGYCINAVVRKHTQLRDASKLRNSICYVNPKSNGHHDIISLTNELIR